MAIAQVLQQQSKHILILGFIALLTACGGGGGGGSKEDTKPDNFSFTAQTNAAPSAEATSNAITIAGINKETDISISAGGLYSIDNGAFTATAGKVTSGKTIKVKLTSAAASNTPKVATLTVGGVTAAFSVTTASDTTAPTVQVLFPPAASLTEGITVKVRGTATDADSTITSLTVAGVPATSTAVPPAKSFSTWTAEVSLARGINSVVVAVTDAFQNTNANAASLSIQSSADLTAANTPNSAIPFSNPWGIALDATRNRVLVTDRNIDAVVAVDLGTGVRTILSDSSTPNAINPFSGARKIDLDEANNRAFVLDDDFNSILAVNLTDGSRTIISDANTPANDTSNPLSLPYDMIFDSARNRLLIADNHNLGREIIAINLATGVRSVLSSDSVPDGINVLSDVGNIALDSANNRLLVADSVLDAIVAVDLTTGARHILSGINMSGPQTSISIAFAIALNPADNQALITTGYTLATALGVVAVNPTSGVRGIVSNSTIPNANNLLIRPFDFVVDSTRNQLFVVENTLKAIVVVDLATGERVILSK